MHRCGRSIGCLGAALILAATAASVRAADFSFPAVVESVQPRMVKLYGAGGVRGLEAYQSAFLISDKGHVLTVWSTVLDTEFLSATLDDGRRFQAKIIGVNPRLEIAVLKIEAEGLPHFDLSKAVPMRSGRRVLAFSNLFGVATGDEPASVQRGMVAAVAPLTARRGAFQSSYQGSVYILDAITNNPGAAGGVLTDRRGRIAGMLGKELRNSQDNTWLNYALPVDAIRSAASDIIAGKTASIEDDGGRKPPKEPLTLSALGIQLVPDVLPKTPPFIDQVRRGSPAQRAGLRPDDLILFVNNRLANSCSFVRQEIGFIDRIDKVRLTIQRGQQLLDVELQADSPPPTDPDSKRPGG